MSPQNYTVLQSMMVEEFGPHAGWAFVTIFAAELHGLLSSHHYKLLAAKPTVGKTESNSNPNVKSEVKVKTEVVVKTEVKVKKEIKVKSEMVKQESVSDFERASSKRRSSSRVKKETEFFQA